MVLVEALHNGGVQMRVESPLIVYDEPGKYTQEVLQIYGE